MDTNSAADPAAPTSDIAAYLRRQIDTAERCADRYRDEISEAMRAGDPTAEKVCVETSLINDGRLAAYRDVLRHLGAERPS